MTGNQPVTVTVAAGSETWKNAAGDTLYAREESDAGLSVQLSLPASGNGYVPGLSYDENRTTVDTLSFSLSAFLVRDPSAADETEAEAAETDAYDPDSDWGDVDSWDEYGYDEDDEDEDDLWWDDSEEDFPDLLIEFHADGTGLPLALPADSAFVLSASVMGALYPDYGFSLNGETKKDGAVTLSLTKPSDPGGTPVTILQCAGTFVPSVEPIVVPDYMQESLENMYNVFSFNEQKIAAFRSKVLPPLVRSIFSFVAAAPTSACQSFLDDLTDTGMLDMLLN